MTGLLRRARLSIALQRWELALITAGSIGLAVVMVIVGNQAQAIAAAHPGCLDPNTFRAGCEAAMKEFDQVTDLGSKLLYFSYGAPFGMGLLLGVPLVAREIDHGTASIAWTLSRSRIRWLSWRLAFVAIAVAVLLALLGVTSERLAQALQPSLHLDADFTWYGRRGWLLIVRGLLALGIGLALGALIGRQLPALLVAILVSVAVFTAVSLGMDRWLESASVPTPFGVEVPGGMQLGERIALPDGRLVRFADLDPDQGYNIAIGPDGRVYASADANGVLSDPRGQVVDLIVPGSAYPTFVLRESALLGALALGSAAATAFVVRRRRPY